MSMKDLLSKMTELQGTQASVEVAPQGKKVLNESTDTVKESKPTLKGVFTSLLSEAEQVTIQPAKQNTQVIKQGEKTLGTVENPQLAQQIKQSIGKGEMTLAGDELGEAKVTDSRVNEIRQLAKQFFGVDPYSSARIDNDNILRLSFRLPEMKEYRYVSLDSINSKDKQTLKDIKKDFLQYMAKKGVSSEEVDMKFHVGSGIYASVRIAIPQKTTEPNLAESKLTEKAVSKSQQQAAGAALAAKRGDAPKSKLTGASKEMAKMSTKELEKFAGTKHKGLPDKKEKTDEAAMPTHDGDFGAGLGAGRSQTTLEAKKTVKKDDKAEKAGKKVTKDIEYDEKVTDKIHGTKRKAEDTKAEKAGKKVAKDIEYDMKKKKVNESMNHNKLEAARLRGKAHALAKESYNCKYDEGTEERSAYHEGFKEGLDECYGVMPIRGLVVGEEMPATVPGMAQQAMEADMEEGNAFTAALAKTPRGGKFSVGGKTFTDRTGYDAQVDEMDMMAFESWDRELNALLNEAVTPKFQVRYLPNNRDTYKIEKGFASKKEAQDWIKGENLRDRAEDISIETSTSKEVNEGKMKDLDMDLGNAKGEPALSDAKFKEKYGKTKAEMKKSLASDSKKPVKEGISVSVSKGQQGAPDSVSVTAQDSDADALLAMIKQAGLGLFGGEEKSGYDSLMSQDQVSVSDQGDVGDHDSMMALIKKMSSTGNDYEDEESQDDQHVHGHPDAACDVCGSSDCGCDDESYSKALVVGEDESEDQMEFEVAEDSAGQEEEEMTTADEDAEAKEDQALAGAMSGNEEEINEGSVKRMAHDKAESMDKEEYISWAADHGMDRSEAIEFWNNVNEEDLTEWANDAGYTGSENTKDNTFEEDIEFMTKVISGGLNGPKKDQTTLPHTKVKVDEVRESILDWKKLSGIK